jgi:hypothetical protein
MSAIHKCLLVMFSFAVGLLIWAFITSLFDMAHAFCSKVIMRGVCAVFGWDISNYSFGGIWFFVSVIQITLGIACNVAAWLFPALDAPLSSYGVLLCWILLLAALFIVCGVGAAPRHSHREQLTAGIVSLLAVPLTLCAAGFVVGAVIITFQLITQSVRV